VLPTPIDPPVGRLTVTENEAPEEDPLQRWRKLQEERLQREMLRSQTVAPDADADAARGEAIQALAEAMATQMQSI
jgi:intracellular multiplication protein IcmE